MKYLLFLVCLILALSLPCFAQDKTADIPKDDDTVAAAEDEKEIANWENSKLRTAFIIKRKDKAGKEREFVAVRMTLAQYNRAKARADRMKVLRPKGKVKPMVRIMLHPRQVNALKALLGKEYRNSKVIIRLSAERLKKCKGLKNRYVIRPKSTFMDKKYVREGKDGLCIQDIKGEIEESVEDLDIQDKVEEIVPKPEDADGDDDDGGDE